MKTSKDEDIRQLNQLISGLTQALNTVTATVQSQGQQINSLLDTRANTPASPVANQLWNGEIGHSVHTWHDTSSPPAIPDTNREAAWWFSHNQPAASQTFIDTDVKTGPDRIDITAHGFTTGLSVQFLDGGGTLPAPLATGITYFIIVLTVDRIQIAATVADAFAGTAINLTSTGSAATTFTVEPYLISTDSRTSTTNNELKTTAHSTYNARYSDWDSTTGEARMTGTMSVDQILPANFIDATVGLARISLIAARRNSYIEIPEECLMAAGIWDNTSGQRKFLSGSIAFNAERIGAPGATERRFRVLLSSDRGYELLSDEIIITDALADGGLNATNNISMSWGQQSGQLQVDIYEHYDPGGANEYRLIAEVSSATSFIYQGGYLRTVSGYPTPTGTVRDATFFTQTADMADLAVDGVAAAWDTVNFPISVPDNYNKGLTTNRQWLRLWQTVAANLLVTGCSTGSGVLIAPSGETPFEAAYSALFPGMTVELYDADDVLVATTTVDSWDDTSHMTLISDPGDLPNLTARIVGAGFHGILIDKVHLGFQQNTSYAPNPLDARVLQPLAAPSSSGQGGVGTGGTGGGIDNCIAEGEPVKLHDGNWVPVQGAKPGALWAAAALLPNLLVKLKPGRSRVRLVRAANGVELICTDTESFIVSRKDWHGLPLHRLRVGDPVVTEIDGRIEDTTIEFIGPLMGWRQVFTPSLSNNHLFIAGRLNLTRWQRFMDWIYRRRRTKGGFVLHNAKPIS